ncbi:MAG: hypothetical protein HQ537_01735 [Parcubacteria group bacterium]|nr:hypothetical protein [Parcubacteria group bacterium]
MAQLVYDKNNQKGYVVIYSIIIISAIVMGIIFSSSWVSLNSVKSSRVLADSKQSKALASACAETALQDIRDNVNYSGSGSLTINGNNCSYIIINQGGENRLIQNWASISDSISKIEILIDQINPQINISSWQEAI